METTEETPLLHLDAMVASLDGKTVIRGRTHGFPSGAGAMGKTLAETLLRGGADAILEGIRPGGGAA
jgi:porphobilinogen deaminase